MSCLQSITVNMSQLLSKFALRKVQQYLISVFWMLFEPWDRRWTFSHSVLPRVHTINVFYQQSYLFFLWFVFPSLLLSACSPYPLIQLLVTVNILQNKKLYDWFSYVHYKVNNHDKLGDSFPFSMKSWGVAPHAILDQLHSKYKNFKLLIEWSTVLYESHNSCKTFCWKTFLYKGSVVILALYAT